jgi:hypothetical protein
MFHDAVFQTVIAYDHQTPAGSQDLDRLLQPLPKILQFIVNLDTYRLKGAGGWMNTGTSTAHRSSDDFS